MDNIKEIEDKVYWLLEALIKEPEDCTSITTTDYAKKILSVVEDYYIPNNLITQREREAVERFVLYVTSEAYKEGARGKVVDISFNVYMLKKMKKFLSQLKQSNKLKGDKE